jgi:hypothetical protein
MTGAASTPRFPYGCGLQFGIGSRLLAPAQVTEFLQIQDDTVCQVEDEGKE